MTNKMNCSKNSGNCPLINFFKSIKSLALVVVLAITGIVLFACTQPAQNAEVNQAIVGNEPLSKEGNTDVKAIEHLTKAAFIEKIFDFEKEKEWKYKGSTPAVIDFYADWCRPCKMLAPIIEELNTEYKGKVRFYKIDTQKEQELANSFGITGIPAILFIPANGQPQMSTGYMGKEDFKKAISEILKVQ